MKIVAPQYSVFNSEGEVIHSPVATHPGEILKDEIEASGLKKNFVAEKLGIRPNHLSELFKGKRNVTAELALKIEEALGIDAGFWIRLQGSHDLTVVRNQHAEHAH
jgi:addiction module HigA family antidote